jgi:hypothetical protein
MKMEFPLCSSAKRSFFVGAHPVGDGLQGKLKGVCHAHRPQGWAPTRIHPLHVNQDYRVLEQ